MADFSTTFKKALDTSVQAVSKAAAVTGKAIGKAATASGKAIGRAATTTLDNARFKMDELGTIRRRNEVLAELGAKVYEMYLAGTELPAEAAEIAARAQVIDCELEVLRSEHKARKEATAQQDAEQPEATQQDAQEAPVLVVEEEAEPTDDQDEPVPTINVPVE